uniref:CSON007426 protein n=1 Tax=Culicoides sonorensis TaxID=179676 RepID=A0A336LXQ9_CULSO
MSKSICRVCFQFEKPVIDMLSNPLPIFEEFQISILEMFLACTEIAMQEGDNSFLCYVCQLRLIEAYKFKIDAQNAMMMLEKINSRENFNEIKDEINIDWKPFEENSKPIVACDPPLRTEISQKSKILLTSSDLKPLNRLYCRYCLIYVKGQLREHEMEHIVKNGGLECDLCGKKFKTRKLILEHIQGVHFTNKSDPNRIRYPCDICGKSYTEKGSLRNHKRDKHSNNPKIREKKLCPHCGEPKKDLAKHIELVHSDKQFLFLCDLCPKTYRSKEALKNHHKLAHELQEPQFQCQQCFKMFKTNGELKSHTNGVHGEDLRLPCDICRKVFKTKSTLRFHKKMHRAPLTFKCEHCNLAFKTKPYLVKHMKTHSDSKDYICKYCSMAFKHSGALSKHAKIHTQAYFYCDLCPHETFLDAYMLRIHTEKIHLGITYRCDTCGKEYGTHKHLKQHQNSNKHDLTKWTKVIPPNVTT